MLPRVMTLGLLATEVSIWVGPAALRVPAGLVLGLILPGLAVTRLVSTWSGRQSRIAMPTADGQKPKIRVARGLHGLPHGLLVPPGVAERGRIGVRTPRRQEHRMRVVRGLYALPHGIEVPAAVGHDISAGAAGCEAGRGARPAWGTRFRDRLAVPVHTTPRSGWARLGGTETLLLVPAVSIFVAIATGLILNAAHLRLSMESWGIALGVVTVGGLAGRVALEGGKLGRRASTRRHQTGTPPSLGAIRRGWWRKRIVVIGTTVSVTAVAVAAALLIATAGESYQGPGFTELWALPGSSSLSPVRIGVISHERHDTRYELVVSVDGRRARASRVTLQPGEEWQSTEPVAQRGQQIGVSLERWPSGTVYREVHLALGQPES